MTRQSGPTNSTPIPLPNLGFTLVPPPPPPGPDSLVTPPIGSDGKGIG